MVCPDSWAKVQPIGGMNTKSDEGIFACVSPEATHSSFIASQGFFFGSGFATGSLEATGGGGGGGFGEQAGRETTAIAARKVRRERPAGRATVREIIGPLGFQVSAFLARCSRPRGLGVRPAC